MGVKKFLDKLTWPVRRIDRVVETELVDKTAITVHAGLQVLDRDLPILTALLSGEKVTLEVRLKENTE